MIQKFDKAIVLRRQSFSMQNKLSGNVRKLEISFSDLEGLIQTHLQRLELDQLTCKQSIQKCLAYWIKTNK